MKSLKIAGKDFIFSQYMSCVEQEDIDQFNEQFSAKDLIAACGVDPQDSTLIIVSFLGDVGFVKPNGKLIPSYATVMLFGRAVKIIFDSKLEVVVESKVITSIATHQELGSQVYINDNYLCDIASHG